MLADAQVDLNPHQIEAALFAFRNPFSRGAILADEVGLGKTIEAGLLLAQKWAERKRDFSSSCPPTCASSGVRNLPTSSLPSVILETRSFNEAIRAGNLNPFSERRSSSARTSLPEPRSHTSSGAWDLVVIDEATDCETSTRHEQDCARHQAGRQRLSEGTADGHAAPELAAGTLRPGQHHRRLCLWRLEELPRRFARLGQSSRLRRTEGAPQADLQADAAPPSARIRSYHQPSRLGAGVRPRPTSRGSTISSLTTSSGRRSTPCRQASAS